MSKIYDNWERLVAAVVKREEIWELCHAPSRSSSFSSISSDFDSISSSRFEKITYRNSLDQGSASEIVDEWVENYAPGVYVTLGNFRDGTRFVILVAFSQRKFKVHQAEAWWLHNKANVCRRYEARTNLSRKEKSSKVKGSDDLIEIEWIEQYETSKGKRVDLRQGGEWTFAEYNRMPRLAIVEDPILEPNFDEILASANLDGRNNLSQHVHVEKIDRFEPGVYVSFGDRIDGIRDVERVRFSRNIFKTHEALAWWVNNREEVYRKYMNTSFQYTFDQCA